MARSVRCRRRTAAVGELGRVNAVRERLEGRGGGWGWVGRGWARWEVLSDVREGVRVRLDPQAVTGIEGEDLGVLEMHERPRQIVCGMALDFSSVVLEVTLDALEVSSRSLIRRRRPDGGEGGFWTEFGWKASVVFGDTKDLLLPESPDASGGDGRRGRPRDHTGASRRPLPRLAHNRRQAAIVSWYKKARGVAVKMFQE